MKTRATSRAATSVKPVAGTNGRTSKAHEAVATVGVAAVDEVQERSTQQRNVYMMWFDDSAKKPAAIKIEEAVAAYVKHFRARPNLVLVNEADRTELPGMLIRSASFVRRDNFWVGWEDAA